MPRIVFVLGAGFTKAFAPRAPLLVDSYDVARIRQKIRSFPYASRLLELELNRGPSNKIDIERLITRLEDGMPYDQYEGPSGDIQVLARQLREELLLRIGQFSSKLVYQPLLTRLARFVVQNSASAVSFNYDDLLDRHLWEVQRVVRTPYDDLKYWHPDGGYGFFCRPASTVIASSHSSMDKTSMLLLKLHGSMNWRALRGETFPAALGSVVHLMTWLPYVDGNGLEMNERIGFF